MGKTQEKGLIGHTAVLYRLTQLGYEVVLPWNESLGYDLAYLVNRGETVEVVRVQCKVAWLAKDGSYIAFNTATLTNRLTKRRTYHGIAELFGVYSPDTEKVYMVAVSESKKGAEMKLRLKPTRNNQEKYVRWAKDYEF